MDITKTIYFVRHGESTGNFGSVHQGPDVVLSDKGVEQAEFVVKRLASLPIDIILSSALPRARQTAEIINHVLQKPIEFSDLLEELRKPSELIGKDRESVEAKKFNAQFDLHKLEEDWKYSDEGCFSERKQRVAKIIQLIKSQEKDNVLVVAHGLIIKFIVAYMMFGKKMSPAEVDRFICFTRLDNTGITVCHLWGEDSWSLASWNDLAHLDKYNPWMDEHGF